MAADTTHPAIRQPSDTSIAVWRYMDFAKYVAMLRTRSVHFARLDTLGDPFEGSLSRSEYEQWKRVAEDGEAKGELPPAWRGHYFDVLMGNARRARKESYVSCWHMNRGESEAMWKLYASSGYAIAICSTYKLLAEALPSQYEPTDHLGPFLGVVDYADHHVDDLPRGNIFHAIMHKRLSFVHEQECRAVIWRAGPQNQIGPTPQNVLDGYPPGVAVPTPLDSLVQRVVVSPAAPSWFTDTVADITSQYSYSFSVEQSALTTKPYL